MEWRKAAYVMTALLLVAGCRLNVGVDGEGTVTSDNNKIDCPGDCKAKIKKGKEITLTATAAEGHYFVGWKGCDSEDENTCVVVGKNKNRKVTATFATDTTLGETTVSDDLKNCALENNYEEATAVSEIKELECNNSIGAFGESFDARGIDQLTSLNELDIHADGGRGLSGLDDIAELPRLETLKLMNLDLSDVSALENLDGGSLETVDLSENGTDICEDVDALVARFPEAEIYASDCSDGSTP